MMVMMHGWAHGSLWSVVGVDDGGQLEGGWHVRAQHGTSLCHKTGKEMRTVGAEVGREGLHGGRSAQACKHARTRARAHTHTRCRCMHTHMHAQAHYSRSVIPTPHPSSQVASPFELGQALHVCFPSEKIVFDSPAKTVAEVAFAHAYERTHAMCVHTHTYTHIHTQRHAKTQPSHTDTPTPHTRLPP